MSRLPKFDTDKLSDSQLEIYNSIISGPRGKFGGPFFALIQAPDIANETQELGTALRFNTKLDALYREIAILTAARYWKNTVEWNAHVVIAQKIGLSVHCINGILQNDIPTSVCQSQQHIYRFCIDLLVEKRVPNDVFTEVQGLIGTEQIVELISIVGYFASLAMLLNTFEIEADPKDGIPPESLLLQDV